MKTKEKPHETPTFKKERPKKRFFLYVEGRGFVRMEDQAGSMPNFYKGEILSFTSRASALYARQFFVSIKLADSIDILAKVA